MYLLVLLSIFAASIVALGFIVGRKLAYLKKLNPEILANGSLSSGGGFWRDIFPELHERWRRLDLGQYRETYLLRSEKLLRRLRVVSLKLDSFTHNLITKIKSASRKPENGYGGIAVGEAERPQFKSVIEPEPVIIVSKKEKLKQKEQDLILQVAQNPKDAELYKKLGNVYVQLKNFADAAESFRAALKLDPDDDKTKVKLERAERKLKQF